MAEAPPPMSSTGRRLVFWSGARVSAYLAVNEQTEKKSTSHLVATRYLHGSVGLEPNREVPTPILAVLLSLGLAALIWGVVSLLLVVS